MSPASAQLSAVAGAAITLSTTQTLTDNGTVQFSTNDTVSLPGGSGPAQILVNAGGTLTATNTTFTGTGSSNITVNTNGTITPTGSTFGVPIFVPYNDVPALTNNHSFDQININNATLSSGELDLNAIGTDTSSLSYNFPKGFTLQSGSSIVVGPGVTVQLPTTQTLSVGGLLQFNSNDKMSLPGGSGPAQILVTAGGTLAATNTTFTGTGSSNITVNTNGTITPTGSTFAVPIFVPYNDVTALTNNYSFDQININNATLSSGELDLNAIGTDTSNLSFNFPKGFTLQSGSSIVVGPGVTVQLPTTQTLSVGGLLQFNSNDKMSLPGGSGPAQILVTAGGTLAATNTTFTGTGSSNITVNTNGTITPTGSTFAVPIFVPYNDVTALTDNYSFDQININNATLSSGELDLNAIGTDTSNLSYNFPKGFTLQSGSSIVVGPGVTVQLPTTQTLSVGGLLQFNSNDKMSLPGGSGPAQILVTTGGTLAATNTTFTGTGSSNITVNTSGTITPTGSTFAVPIFVPYNDVTALTNNYSFDQINIDNATLSSGELDLNAIGTDTSNLSFNFPKGFTLQSGSSIVVGPGVTGPVSHNANARRWRKPRVPEQRHSEPARRIRARIDRRQFRRCIDGNRRGVHRDRYIKHHCQFRRQFSRHQHLRRLAERGVERRLDRHDERRRRLRQDYDQERRDHRHRRQRFHERAGQGHHRRRHFDCHDRSGIQLLGYDLAIADARQILDHTTDTTRAHR